jgi:membrane associated rhomboid family serine protease
VIDILPTLALSTPCSNPSRRTLRAWSLVLSSRGVLNRIDGERLLVAPKLAVVAAAEIEAYEWENKPSVPLPPLPDNTWVSLTIIGLYVLANAWLDGSGLAVRLDWHLAGRADAALILAGQWWRCVTALFLHADAGHLLSNIAALALLGTMLGRRIGSGLTWFFFLATGALGNALNAWAQAPDHLSVGASTGVFGLIGVLAGGAGVVGSERRAGIFLLSAGFGFSLLAMLGAGEERIDLGAHLFGLLCGLPLGLLVGRWRGAVGWKGVLNVLAGAAAIVVTARAWSMAVSF